MQKGKAEMFHIWAKPSKVMNQVLFILMINLTHLKRFLFIFELFKYKFSASDPILSL